jgi:hypothetical protein
MLTNLPGKLIDCPLKIKYKILGQEKMYSKKTQRTVEKTYVTLDIYLTKSRREREPQMEIMIIFHFGTLFSQK